MIFFRIRNLRAYICRKMTFLKMQKPNVFFFNPTCELAVANASFSYMPPALLRKMEIDLSILPFIFASDDDIVISAHAPSLSFRDKIKSCGLPVPSFLALKELVNFPANSFGKIIPWGWSPAAHFQLSEIKQKCSEEITFWDWSDQYKLLYERKEALKFLKKLLAENQEDWLIDPAQTGEICDSVEEVESFIFRQGNSVIKAPLSSSGRGIQIIRKDQLNKSNKQWISGVLNQQKYLIAEPLLEKIADLSFHFEFTDDGKILSYGHSFFETNSNGQYRGNFIRPDLNLLFQENEVVKFIEANIGRTENILKEDLSQSVYSKYYKGFLGIDAMIFRQNGKLKMQPCIEINARMNMGILTRKLEKSIHATATGKFAIFYGDEGLFKLYAETQSAKFPVKIEEGKVKSGFVALTEPDARKNFGAYMLLGRAR